MRRCCASPWGVGCASRSVTALQVKSSVRDMKAHVLVVSHGVDNSAFSRFVASILVCVAQHALVSVRGKHRARAFRLAT